MKIIGFLFGKCSDTVLGKIVYVLMVLFVLTADFLSLFHTDFTDFVDILMNLFFIIMSIGVFRGLYAKFREGQLVNYKICPDVYITEMQFMKIIEIIFGKCGNTLFSKIIYIIMILYIIVSFFIVNLKYTDFANFSEIVLMILGTVFNILWWRTIYRLIFHKHKK